MFVCLSVVKVLSNCNKLCVRRSPLGALQQTIWARSGLWSADDGLASGGHGEVSAVSNGLHPLRPVFFMIIKYVHNQFQILWVTACCPRLVAPPRSHASRATNGVCSVLHAILQRPYHRAVIGASLRVGFGLGSVHGRPLTRQTPAGC